jgi:hypothetical protein
MGDLHTCLINEVESDDIEIAINLNEDNHDDVLNAPISQAEIENVILNLYNDKSSGLDNVTNEYFIKYCVSTLFRKTIQYIP